MEFIDLYEFYILQYLPRYPGAGLGIGEGMVVMSKVIAAELGDGVELMVLCIGEGSA